MPEREKKKKKEKTHTKTKKKNSTFKLQLVSVKPLKHRKHLPRKVVDSYPALENAYSRRHDPDENVRVALILQSWIVKEYRDTDDP